MKRVLIGLIASTALTGAALAQTTTPGTTPTTPPAQTAPTTTPMTPGSPAARPAGPAKMTDVWKGTGAVAYYTTNTADVGADQLIGLTVYNAKDETVGKIEDVILDSNRTVKAFVIGVGGFLGLGERWVAVEPGSVSIMKSDANSFRGMMNVTADELKKAPEFKYQRPAS